MDGERERTGSGGKTVPDEQYGLSTHEWEAVLRPAEG